MFCLQNHPKYAPIYLNLPSGNKHRFFSARPCGAGPCFYARAASKSGVFFDWSRLKGWTYKAEKRPWRSFSRDKRQEKLISNKSCDILFLNNANCKCKLDTRTVKIS